MDDTEPPSYNTAFAGGVAPSAPSINAEFASGGVAPSAPSINAAFASGGASTSASGTDDRYFSRKYDDKISVCNPHINEGFQPENDYIKPPTVPPPIYTELPMIKVTSFDPLTNEMIRNACYEYVEETCCYGSRAVRDMTHTSVDNNRSLHYKLESYGEKRQSADRTTGYHGQTIDGPENGPAPAPWEMTVHHRINFENDRLTKEIPHTAYVKTCWRCDGRGKIDCSSCGGDGYNSCSTCSGRGRVSNNDDDNTESTCSSCGGSGTTSCWRCSGSGKVTCNTCDGHGKLKHYRELIVTWKNHIDDFVSNSMKLPSELLLNSSGREVFREQKPAVSPISHSPDAILNEASRKLVNKHQRVYRNEHILEQRHTIRAIPITQVSYRWRKKEGEFYVYSFENKVYFEEYPQKCCCCICC